MRVNQTVKTIQSQTMSQNAQRLPVKPQELPMSAADTLFPLHHLDAFLYFVFQLLLVFIISASVFPALNWLNIQIQQFASSYPTK
jgi:hypothetical protein